MKIKTVTIVVRGERGEIKKAIYDGAGNIMTGDVSVLEEQKWEPKQSAPAPLSPEEAAESLRKATEPVKTAEVYDDAPEDAEVPDSDVEG